MKSTNDNITRLEIVPVRKAFPKEAGHFTTWLENHIEALGHRLGIGLTVVKREKDCGDFNVDLLCEDDESHPVVIENQLEKTDHDHLGKLLTYLVNLEAKRAIWVTTDPRPEHQKVIEWLNESTGADLGFYLVKVEATRIGTSPYAPLFTVLSAPDKGTKQFGEEKKEWAERHVQRLEFWKGLLEKCKQKAKFFSNISPGRYHWIGTGAGKGGVTFNFCIFRDCGTVELYIDHDKTTGKGNKAIFDRLRSQKQATEKDFGGTLDWERLNDKRACRISKTFENAGLTTPDKWPSLQDSMVAAMARLEKSLRPRVAKLDV